MRILFIMDPVSRIAVAEDTTYGLVREVQAQKGEAWHALASGVRLESRPEKPSRLQITCAPILPPASCSPASSTASAAANASAASGALAHPPLLLGELQTKAPTEFDLIWVRKDPPFDAGYLWLTLLLEHARPHVRIVNDPRGLRDANEKLYTCHFSHLMPETAVCAARSDIEAFVRDVGGQAVLKPIDGYAGGGIFLLREGDPNFGSIVDSQTREGTLSVMLQRFLPEVVRGDKRILLVAGEPIGAIWRVPQGGDVRSNIHVGGRVALAGLADDDTRICRDLAPRLVADGLVFVGLDVIGGKLTEVNVTSPTGLRQMAELTGHNLAARTLTLLGL